MIVFAVLSKIYAYLNLLLLFGGVEYLSNHYDLSEQRCCAVLGSHRFYLGIKSLRVDSVG